jgi:serine/threonine protein kinase
MAVDPQLVKSLFLVASDLNSPAERAAYLDRECAGQSDLRARVEALLSADSSPVRGLTFADETIPNAQAASAQPTSAVAPHALDDAAGLLLAGKYKLLERIGEGGMGSVWLAQQSEPVKRKVAIKLIKLGMDSRQVLLRFEAERQALAMMDHPNIAKVLDGGLAPDGRPFFVMELVKGTPITEFCDARKLSLAERLELFVPVCQAIQHAHQKGIIHRDIKPSNVMIAMYDDHPVPKVIDFGIAKATGQSLSEVTLNTGFGGVIGTPQYMSPEQATLNNLDIDTRSDVYSLGVLLYELLTGSPPFTKAELDNKGLMEVLRVVREDEPPKPSTKLSSAATLPTLSANRSIEPRRLRQMLQSELDWIVMKALEKNRARRYETANSLAADVQRYLTGDPVTAHPPSSTYRLKKFVRRHRGPLMAASVVVLALLVGAATVFTVKVRSNRELAIKNDELADEHPNIAKVLDAGSTDTGRPYFVMEYIKGVSIIEYCDTDKLNMQGRLALFMSVCHAIQHAHQKGIIHRDIKPSNVLVTMHDGVPVPKVIAFGIAKATSAELTTRTLFTEHRQMIGTPAYMSPEQAEMSGLDIDTRSDIYSLGVLLYELLTGTTPFASKSLMEAGFAEMMRIIREVEPHKPSTRLSSLGATGTRTAEQRQLGDVKKSGLLLKGDLDWIVMKCLEKDRTRRYETANWLAEHQSGICDRPELCCRLPDLRHSARHLLLGLHSHVPNLSLHHIFPSALRNIPPASKCL